MPSQKKARQNICKKDFWRKTLSRKRIFRQMTEQICVKQPNEIPSNSRTNLRQTAERAYIIVGKSKD